jgi:hypothetical protein
VAARITSKHKQDVRERIQTSQLVNRLQANALGTIAKELTPGQLKSIEILLKKTVPDLSSVAHTDPDGKPAKIIHVWEG